MARKPDLPSDFNPTEVTQSVQEHGETLDALAGRIEYLEKKLSDSSQFAAMFKTHIEESKPLDAAFALYIKSALKNNTDIKESFTRFVDDIDANAVKKTLKGWTGKFLFAIWSIGLIIITGAVTWWFNSKGG